MIITKRAKSIINRRKKDIGALGEALVVKHLVGKGLKHIESNFLKKQGELDVIMSESGKIHFFEVKTVSRENMFKAIVGRKDVIRETVTRETTVSTNHLPEENVSRWKQKKIAKVVQIYLLEKKLEDRDWQFNVAIVFLDRKNKKAIIKFIKDIPLNA